MILKCIFILTCIYSHIHISVAQNYFRYPLDSLPNFISPFGGLRDNHFHSGIDLKTNEREGLPVFASADGYVSRIKIQSIGYGKAIYIDHKNGYTTVYGHLQKYHGKIAEWIHAYQYKNENFEFDKVFEKAVLYVKKGDTIGFSGNSGGSTGPHLHFEIRDTKSEEIMNPALFGIMPFDTLRPIIKKVIFYNFKSEGAYVSNEINIKSNNIFNYDSVWIYKDTIDIDTDLYGVGIETYDYIHNLSDKKNIYGYQISYDSKNIFGCKLNQFSFDESKFINAHIDYSYYKTNQIRIQKGFLDDGNEIKLYKYDNKKGKFLLNDFNAHRVEILVNDFSGNSIKLIMYIKALTMHFIYNRQAHYTKMFYPFTSNCLIKKDFKLQLEAKSIYDTIPFYYKVLPKLKNGYSKTYQVHDYLTPLRKSADIFIKPFKVKKEYESKLLLAYFDKNEKKYRAVGGTYNNGFVEGKAANFGNYFVAIDTIAPSIKTWQPINENDSTDNTTWQFEIKDNFSGIAKYEAFLNGKWVLMDYDAKNNMLSYKLDEIYFDMIKNSPISKPLLLIRVMDKKGNTAELKQVIGE